MSCDRRRFLAVGLALAWPATSANGASANGAAPTTPPPGSPQRAALLDAVRAALGLNPRASRFKVSHLRSAGNWAYFEGNEVVPLDGREWQETDLTVKALLAHGKGGWRVSLKWTLPGDDTHPLRRFERQLADKRDQDKIPEGIFP